MNIFLLQTYKTAEFFRHLLINALSSQLKMEMKQTQKCKGQNHQQNPTPINFSLLLIHVNVFCSWPQISTASI